MSHEDPRGSKSRVASTTSRLLALAQSESYLIDEWKDEIDRAVVAPRYTTHSCEVAVWYVSELRERERGSRGLTRSGPPNPKRSL